MVLSWKSLASSKKKEVKKKNKKERNLSTWVCIERLSDISLPASDLSCVTYRLTLARLIMFHFCVWYHIRRYICKWKAWFSSNEDVCSTVPRDIRIFLDLGSEKYLWNGARLGFRYCFLLYSNDIVHHASLEKVRRSELKNTSVCCSGFTCVCITKLLTWVRAFLFCFIFLPLSTSLFSKIGILTPSSIFPVNKKIDFCLHSQLILRYCMDLEHIAFCLLFFGPKVLIMDMKQ